MPSRSLRQFSRAGDFAGPVRLTATPEDGIGLPTTGAVPKADRRRRRTLGLAIPVPTPDRGATHLDPLAELRGEFEARLRAVTDCQQAEIDALRREVHALRRTVQDLRRPTSDDGPTLGAAVRGPRPAVSAADHGDLAALGH